MNYVRYDTENGDIKNYGYMSEELVQAEVDAGKPTLLVTDVGDFENWKVNLETKQLERVNSADPLPEVPSDLQAFYNSVNGATSS